MSKLTKAQREALELEARNLTEDALELERKAQQIRRRLSQDETP